MPAKLESLGPRSADGPLRTAVAKAIILPLWGLRGIDQLESYDFGAERKRLKSPDRCLFNRAERVMNGRGLTGCRSVAEAAWQSSDTALPIGQVF